MEKPMTNKKRNAVAGYLFILPWIVGLLAFVAYPVVYSILLSLSTAKVTTSGIEMKWAGLTYYTRALAQDTTFTSTIAETVLFMACAVPVILVFSLMIAILLNSKFRLRGFFRSVFFLPVIIMSGPAISELLTKYTVDFSESGAGIYEFLATLPDFLQTPALFILNNLVLILWFSGVQILIFLAGLQKISPEIYEAASIDGVNAWQNFWQITFPLIGPFFTINMVLSLKNSLGAFDQVMALTKGGPDSKTETVSYLIFQNGLGNGEYSYQMANAVTFFIVLAILAFVQLKFFSGKEKV